MKKVKALRRMAIIAFAFFLGLYASGNFPAWAILAFGTFSTLWLMAYDEASYRLYEKNAK